MRCRACDANLSDFESTRRSTVTKEFIDLCSRCFSEVQPFLNTSENFRNYQGELDGITNDPIDDEPNEI